MPLLTLLGMAGAFLAVFAFTPGMVKLAHKIGAVDPPGDRKVHNQMMPRLGGLAIYLGFTLAVLLSQPLTRAVWGLLAGGTLIAVLGLIDDIRGLSPRVKLVGQVAAALVLVAFGVQVDWVTNPLKGVLAPWFQDIQMFSLGKLGLPVTVLWIIGITNAVNLMDGLDGLAAGTASIAALTMALVAWSEGQILASGMALILTAGTLGFLRFNFHPARIFMGDSGSMFLGYNLAALAIMGLAKGAAVLSLFVPVVILGIPILETVLTILRRFVRRQPIFQADKQHIHHFLLELGLSHRQTVLVIYLVSICLGISAVLLTVLSTEEGVAMLIALCLIGSLAANRLRIVAQRTLARKKTSLQRVAQQKSSFRA